LYLQFTIVRGLTRPQLPTVVVCAGRGNIGVRGGGGDGGFAKENPPTEGWGGYGGNIDGPEVAELSVGR
jgi:hypothetical protein